MTQTTQLKVLSLKQPWATLIAIGAKKIETRSWPTKHRGPLLIHASASWDKAGRELFKHPVCNDILLMEGFGEMDLIPLGKIVGFAQVNDCKPIRELKGDVDPRYQDFPPMPELLFGGYGLGRSAWILDERVYGKFNNPPAFKGKLGFANIEVTYKMLWADWRANDHDLIAPWFS